MVALSDTHVAPPSRVTTAEPLVPPPDFTTPRMPAVSAALVMTALPPLVNLVSLLSVVPVPVSLVIAMRYAALSCNDVALAASGIRLVVSPLIPAIVLQPNVLVEASYVTALPAPVHVVSALICHTVPLPTSSESSVGVSDVQSILPLVTSQMTPLVPPVTVVVPDVIVAEPPAAAAGLNTPGVAPRVWALAIAGASARARARSVRLSMYAP